MFRDFAEDIVFYLTKRKVLNQDNREIYEYALEVILLNTSLLIILLLISVFVGEYLFFLCYLCFFLPIRIFSGGYHLKRSETCFFVSILSYVILLIVLKANILLYKNEMVYIASLMIMTMIALFSPIKNDNHPMSDKQIRRNKTIIRVVIFIYVGLLIVFHINEIIIASYEIIFVLFNGILFMLGKIENCVAANNIEKGEQKL